MTGSGTLADPYIIWNVNDLQNVSLNPTAYYELGQDIDASATSTWNQLLDRGAWAPFTDYVVNDFVTYIGYKWYCITAHTSAGTFTYSEWGLTDLDAGSYIGFNPIGSSTSPFIGTFDGKGYLITGLYINRGGELVGLFKYATGATIQNVELDNCDITGDWVGALVWQAQDTNITNCSMSGSVSGSAAGGLVYIYKGVSTTPTITQCHTSGSVLGVGWAGGLFVTVKKAIITKCYSTANVTSTAGDASGFVDRADINSVITECYATGDVTADNRASGFVRYTVKGQISNCYARGDVSAFGSDAAGFCNMVQYSQSSITKCYSTGLVNSIGGTEYGFAYNLPPEPGTISGCYWDTQTSGVSSSGFGEGGTGKTTAEMKVQLTYSGWDFISIWDMSRITTGLATSITSGSAVLTGLLDVTIMNDLYPILQWQSLLGLPCNCGFEWGDTGLFGNPTPVDSKNTGESFAKAISTLEPETTYYFRARASSSPGPIYGATKSFTTTALPLIEVETLPATNITESSARIWGRVRKVPITAMARFDWGGNIEYGAQTPWAPGLVSDDMFYHDLTNLAEGRAYHFRAMAMGSALVYGNDMVFTTLSPLGPVTLIQEELAHLMEVS